jgi:hypothetical protein
MKKILFVICLFGQGSLWAADAAALKAEIEKSRVERKQKIAKIKQSLAQGNEKIAEWKRESAQNSDKQKINKST